MEQFRRGLAILPPWCMTFTTLLVILWLTLAAKPLGDDPPQLFPGADKVAHALMFGFFTVMMALDWQRKHRWKNENATRVFTYATLSAITGILIEFAQRSMHLGRSFEIEDIIADSAGAYICAILWLFCQNSWTKIN